MNNNMIYQTYEKPPFAKNIFFSLQQLLSIIAATMLVPLIVATNNSLGGIYLSQSAALLGAGVGTIVYLLFSKFKSPVFLGSSFAFITPLVTAVNFGYFGIILGSIFAGLVYVIIALVIKLAGTNWIDKLMPPIIIGPTVALIGFDLSSSAIANVMNTSADTATTTNYSLITILVGLATFFIVIWFSVKGPKKLKMFPFIAGILGGYILALILTGIGHLANAPILQLINFEPFTRIGDFSNWLPNITFVGFINEGFSEIHSFGDILTLFVAFAPIAFVSFAEHIADHKNISSIIDTDLLKDPGLHRTLLGDGVGSIAGAVFGGCPNTTYGESIGCVALSRNASTFTILTTAILCVVIAFFYPVIAFIESIPVCVVGGVCIALYGFISISGLRMLKNIDLNESRNLFVVASIFICGIGGLTIKFGNPLTPVVSITNIACALIVGIIANLILKQSKKEVAETEEMPPEQNENTLKTKEQPDKNPKNLDKKQPKKQEKTDKKQLKNQEKIDKKPKKIEENEAKQSNPTSKNTSNSESKTKDELLKKMKKNS